MSETMDSSNGSVVHLREINNAVKSGAALRETTDEVFLTDGKRTLGPIPRTAIYSMLDGIGEVERELEQGRTSPFDDLPPVA